MSTKLDAIYAKAGLKKSREILQRAAVAAGFDSGPEMMSEAGARNAQVAGARPNWKGSVFGQLARLEPADKSPMASPATQNAFASPRIGQTDLHRKTQPGYWEKYEPGEESSFDRHFYRATGWRNTSDDEEMAAFERTMERWSRRGRLRSLGRRSTAFDAAAEFLSPAQTVEEAKRAVTETFGHDRSCDFLSLEYMLKRLPPQSLVREVPEGQRQAMSAILARLGLA